MHALERGEGRDLQVYTTGSHGTYLCVPIIRNSLPLKALSPHAAVASV